LSPFVPKIHEHLIGDIVKKSIVILESKKEYYTNSEGNRVDTKPIIQALQKKGFESEVLFYKSQDISEIKKYLTKNSVSALLVRISAGTINKLDIFFGFLDDLAKSGIKIYTDHNSMLKIDYKDILIKLKDRPYCTNDIKAYYNVKEFRKEFIKSIMSTRIRVLKKNYGSVGEDVWQVRLQDNGSVIATEAIDNKKVIYRDLPSFFNDFEKKFEYRHKREKYTKDKASFIDMRYLSQIEDGEYRVLLVKDKIKHIIHKKPQNDSFSATYLSGAIYETKNRKKEKWDELKELVKEATKDIQKEIKELPILWSMDFIKDKKSYTLSEINSSCVEIDTVPEVSEDIADAIYQDLEEQK
jgi:glutathione synthase/RimK-type ligase-like ATP-grasp enzyme